MASEQQSGGKNGGTRDAAAGPGGLAHNTSDSAFHLFPDPSFQSLGSYVRAVAETGLRFRRRVFARATVATEVSDIVMRSKNKMRRSLNWWDLTWLSIGSVVRVDIFLVTSTFISNQSLQTSTVVDPGLVLSFVVAGVSSILSVFCYTECAVEVSVAVSPYVLVLLTGGSFAFLRVELGAFVAFITAGNIISEYVIGAAAVARAWTSYLATLINRQPNDLLIQVYQLAEKVIKLKI